MQMSFKPVRVNMVTPVDLDKEAWDALKGMFEARDTVQLLRLLKERGGLKKGDDETIIKQKSRTMMI